MKRALIFPGQGVQAVGMGKDFFLAFSKAKETFQEADDLLNTSLSKVIFEGPQELLTRTEWSQLAIFVTSIALLRTVEEELSFEAAAGLSLGEYSALVASKKCSFQEALFLVKQRGALMSAACDQNPGTMAVVLGLDFDFVKKFEVPGQLWVANANSPGQIVISGTLPGIEGAKEALKAAGAKRVLPLDVHGAFHSGLMKSAELALQPAIEEANFNESEIDLYMNVPGDKVSDLQQMRRYLKEQVTHPVLFMRSIQKMVEAGIQHFIEIGPGSTLSSMLKRIPGAENVQSLSTVEQLDGLVIKR